MVIILCCGLASQGFSESPAGNKAQAVPKQESAQGIQQAPAGEKAGPGEKQVPSTFFGIEEPKDAGAFFKEAQKLAQNDPIGAIRLYQQGLVLKPDAWTERRQLGLLYERQGQWGIGISEYEAINKATGSKESFTDLIRAMENGGFYRSAAVSAREAFNKYPDPVFLYTAAELFEKSGAEEEALTALRELIKIKPDDGKAFFLLGSINEKAGRFADGLRAYIRAGELLKDDRNAADAVKRLQARIVTVEGLTVIPPPGWLPDKNGLVNPDNGQQVTVGVAAAGDPAEVARRAARETMPEELFTDEALKSSAQLKEKLAEMEKTDPGAAEIIRSVPMPSLNTRDFPGFKGAKIVLASTGEISLPGMESAAALAAPSGGKIYTMVWRGSAPVEDGLKVITDFLEQTMWSE